MEFKLFLKLIIDFIKNPKETWEYIDINKYSTKNIFIDFLMPLVIIGSSFKLIGRFTNFEDYSAINAILTCISFILISLSIIYISSWIINELLPKFKSDKNFILVFVLISFSSFPAIISSALSSLHPNLSFLNILSVYSIVLFWVGVNQLLQIPKEHIIGFVLISLIIIISVSLIISFFIMSVFISIF